MEGRGRGRGGGVPLLPSGLWQSLTSEAPAPIDIDVKIKALSNSAQFEDDVNDHAPPAGTAHYNHNKSSVGPPKKGGIPDPAVDWTCPSCTNVNWAKRPTCNMCNAPKPKSILSEDEVRTGAGGGFNERQERAAATTVEVADDGFDDFGRRTAKEKKAADKKAKEAAALMRLHGTFGITASEGVDITNASQLAYSVVPDSGAQVVPTATKKENLFQRRRSRSRSPVRKPVAVERSDDRGYDSRRRDRDRDDRRDRDRDRDDGRDDPRRAYDDSRRRDGRW